MSLQTLTIKDTFANDADFRAWGSGISTRLAALGFVQTTDTGQINWSTVTKPVAISTAAGYEIWRFADTLQATSPIFFKIEYGTSNSVSSPQLWATVGTASDGAGTITNNASFANSVTARNTALSTSSTMAGTVGSISLWAESSGGGALGILLWPSIGESSFQGGVFGVERFRNLDGTASGDGYNVTWSNAVTATGGSGGSLSKAYFYSASMVQPAQTNGNLAPGAAAGTAGPGSNIIGSTLYPMPVFTGFTPPRLYGPSQMFIVFPKSDIAAGGTTFSMSHYGVNRTWISAGQGYSGSQTGWSSWTMSVAAGWSFAMRGD